MSKEEINKLKVEETAGAEEQTPRWVRKSAVMSHPLLVWGYRYWWDNSWDAIPYKTGEIKENFCQFFWAAVLWSWITWLSTPKWESRKYDLLANIVSVPLFWLMVVANLVVLGWASTLEPAARNFWAYAMLVHFLLMVAASFFFVITIDDYYFSHKRQWWYFVISPLIIFVGLKKFWHGPVTSFGRWLKDGHVWIGNVPVRYWHILVLAVTVIGVIIDAQFTFNVYYYLIVGSLALLAIFAAMAIVIFLVLWVESLFTGVPVFERDTEQSKNEPGMLAELWAMIVEWKNSKFCPFISVDYTRYENSAFNRNR